MYDILIKNGLCVTPQGTTVLDVALVDGKIADMGQINAPAETIINAKGLHVLPGLIDSQVHFREPGLEHKEDFFTGTKAAVLGGITSIFEMPNTKPPTTTAEALADKVARMHERAWCNFAFFVGGTFDKGADWHQLERLPGCCGIKIFMGSSTGDLLVDEDEAIFHILKNSTRRTAVHCEDEARLKTRFHLAQAGAHARSHPIWRDEQTALRASTRLIALAEKAEHPVQILHVTTAEEMALLSQHKKWCSVEVLPQHLTFCDEDYERLGTHLQMNPPIRAARHREALWKALAAGVVDVIGSDHAPHTLEEKAQPYPQSPAGLPGVQTTVPVMLNHIHAGRLSIERLCELMAANPARLYNIKNKGALVPGNDADVTLVDLNKKVTITNQQMASRCGWTPYDGMQVTGWPTHTIVNGEVVMQEDTLLIDTPRGQPVRFELEAS